MTNPTIVVSVKMEYGRNFSISGLEMMVKSGLGRIFLKLLHVQAIFYQIHLPHRKLGGVLIKSTHKFSNKNDMVCAKKYCGIL